MKSSEKPRMTKDTVPEDFTLSLALVDFIPVVFFGLTFVLLGIKLESIFFIAGALACLFAGAAKVLWKIIVVLKKKNIWWMFLQMRIFMPIGFLTMITGFVLKLSVIDGNAVWLAVISFPSVIFFALGLLGMIMMGVFAFALNNSDLRSNWIEQLTNGAAQICIFVGVALLM